jgi:cbb3-type cytochrome oxidase subunit 3
MWMTAGVLLVLMIVFIIIWWFTFNRMKADS